MCHLGTEWTRSLSTVLLGLRTHVRVDTDASPAEFLFGTTLRVSSKFFLPENFAPDLNVFLLEFRETMRKVRPVPVEHKSNKKVFYFEDLQFCYHVFRRHMTKKALECPYTGPHKVLKRVSEKVFNIDINSVSKSVSVELLQPAHFVEEETVNTEIVPSTPRPYENCDIEAVKPRWFERLKKKVTFANN